MNENDLDISRLPKKKITYLNLVTYLILSSYLHIYSTRIFFKNPVILYSIYHYQSIMIHVGIGTGGGQL